MLIECSYCEVRTDATEIGHSDEHDETDFAPFRITLLKCPICKRGLVAGQYLLPDGHGNYEWEAAGRLWPSPLKPMATDIPPTVRVSLQEADRCYRGGAYTACAVMCGRALEAICLEHKFRGTLAKGLKSLRDSQIIDGRLFEWSEELRGQRNLAAHPSDQVLSKDDARDLLDFTHAICEYVFVLTAKHQAFRKRQADAAKRRAAKPKP